MISRPHNGESLAKEPVARDFATPQKAISESHRLQVLLCGTKNHLKSLAISDYS